MWRKHVNKIHLIALFIGVLCPTALSAVEEPYYHSDFAKNWTGWQGWNPNSEVKLSIVADSGLKKEVLELKLAAPDEQRWMVPYIEFKPFKVDRRTMIRFRIKGDFDRDNELTFFDRTEGSEYSVFFPVKKGTWVTVRKYLYRADYKKAGKPGIECDGLIGDAVNGFRIVTRGESVRIADVEIFQARTDHEEELPYSSDQAELDSLRANYRAADYPVLRRNGIFPYGAISRIDANVEAVKLFGRPLEATLRDDLADMRRHYLNTYINFCDSTPLSLRLKLAEETGMRLIETMFCGTNFAELPSDSPQWKQFEQAKNSPVVLAWYGKDEPSLSDYLHYLANKKKIMEMDAEHPLTSALHIDSSRRALGPMLEVVMSDIYPLEFQTPKDGAAILRNFDVLRRCRDWSAGNRVWLVAQAFSNRQKFHYSSRYSTPEEMNLTLYSAIAAGANGILFFIYNDLPTILDGKLRVEEFDRTLVDPWGNGNPVYDRIAEFGKNIAPIMPSFLDAASGDYVRIDSPDELLVGQLKNELGVLVIPVNKSTEAEWTGTLSLHLPAGCDLYDLETLKPAKIRPLRLRPGMGAVLLVATPEHFRTIAAEITTRRNNMEAELAELHRKELISAGFPDGKASPDWLAAKNQLAGIQQIFGDIYSYLTEPAQIEKAETDLTFKPALEEIKLLSCRYFELRRNLYSGAIPAHAELEKLKQELDMLAVRCRSLR